MARTTSYFSTGGVPIDLTTTRPTTPRTGLPGHGLSSIVGALAARAGRSPLLGPPGERLCAYGALGVPAPPDARSDARATRPPCRRARPRPRPWARTSRREGAEQLGVDVATKEALDVPWRDRVQHECVAAVRELRSATASLARPLPVLLRAEHLAEQLYLLCLAMVRRRAARTSLERLAQSSAHVARVARRLPLESEPEPPRRR